MLNQIPLRVNDLKQWAYCPRVVFYQRRLPVDFRPTFKMRRGQVEQERIQRLESRRKLKRFGLAGARRRFHVRLHSRALNLSGLLDMLLETKKRLIPVDFKFSAQPVRKNHHLQLAGYALLLEEAYSRPVDTGFIYLIPAEEPVVVKMSSELKEVAKELLGMIRLAILEGILPPPTAVRNRCVDCEFRNFCGDVF